MDLIGTSHKPLAVITGAYGGTGRAVARRLGARYRLVLVGRDEAKVAGLSESLVEEGYDVALAVTADDLITKLEASLREPCSSQTRYSFAVRAYGASKRGMLRLVERSAVDWARRGARVVSVSPGPTLTPMGRAELAANPLAVAAASATPLGPVGRPADIAAAVDFLASDSASYITGCDLRVDGGTVAARLHPPRPAS